MSPEQNIFRWTWLTLLVRILLLPHAIAVGAVLGIALGAFHLPHQGLRWLVGGLAGLFDYFKAWQAWADGESAELIKKQKGWLLVWFIWMLVYFASALSWAPCLGALLGLMSAIGHCLSRVPGRRIPAFIADLIHRYTNPLPSRQR